MRNKKKMVIIGTFIVLVLLFGVTYAWFSYYQEGKERKLVAGDIYLTLNSGNGINLINMFPESEEEARSRNDNYLTFTLSGKNTSNKDLIYEITLKYGEDKPSPYERYHDKNLLFDLVELDDNDDEVRYLLDAVGYNEINNTKIWIDTVNANTNSNITRKYKLRMWINEDTIISDTVPNADYAATGEHAFKNFYGNIKVEVFGDFTEKVRDGNVRVVYDANGGTVDTLYKYYEPGETYGELPVPVRKGYKFVGWEVNGEAVISSDVVDIGYKDGYKYTGDYVFDGTNYIDTGVYLFSQANYQRNFYVEFEIKQIGVGHAQATLFNCKNESGDPWPGVVFRKSSGSNYYEVGGNVASGNTNRIEQLPYTTMKVRLLKVDNKFYYSLNNNEYALVKDFAGFSLTFDFPAVFGASLDGNGNIQRGFKGTLSNILLTYLADGVTMNNYENHMLIKEGVTTLRAKWILDTMNTFPEFITNNKENIKKIYFKKENDTDLARYNATNSNVKADIATIGSVKAWLEPDIQDNTKYILYVESETQTYLTTGSYLFQGYTNLEEIHFDNINTSNVTNMKGMFSRCSNLISLDLSNFDTSNVTAMGNYADDGMFQECISLRNLNLSSFDTRKVTEFGYMFSQCSSLTSLDLSNFNTSSVTNMIQMFYNCSSLTSLDVSNFNTSSVTDMKQMFYNCSSLTSLNISSFNTSSVTNMNYMFFNCNKLTSLDLSNFTTSSVQYMQSMFCECTSLTTLNITNFNTSNVTSMYEMFKNCRSLTSLNVSNFNTSNVIYMHYMFNKCSSLTSLDVSNFDTSKVTNMTDMFNNCSSLTSLTLWSGGTGNDCTMLNMFGACSSLTSLDLSGFNTSKVKYMDGMFDGCTSLTSLNLSNFNTSNVFGMSRMFKNCSSLTSLNVSNFNTSSVTNMAQIFQGCTSLTSLTLWSGGTGNNCSMAAMFQNCSGLTSLNVSGLNTSNVSDMASMFRNCSGLTSLDLSNFNTSNVQNMGSMFGSCSGLTSLNLSNFNTSNVKNMSSMFAYCNIPVLDLSSFDTSSVTTMNAMFYLNRNLQRIYVSNTWIVNSGVNSELMFAACNSLVGVAPNTTYPRLNSDPENATYAVIATDSVKGYLTDISLKPSV